jgi:uncharacterized membrane protein
MKKIDWFLLGIIGAMLICGAIIYPKLPDQVPMHWNAAGEIDGYGSPLAGVFGIPLLTLGILLLLLVTPKIDPRKENYAKFSGVYNILKTFLVLFMVFMYIVTLMAAFEHQIKVGLFVKFALGLLFIVIGNYFGKIRHNYFVGIKTPWTLADETVWNKTHRLAGPLWIVAGIVALVVAFFDHPASFWIFMACLMIAAIIPTIYSYVIYKNTSK